MVAVFQNLIAVIEKLVAVAVKLVAMTEKLFPVARGGQKSRSRWSKIYSLR